MSREQKITFGEMRQSGVSRIDVFCSDYRCSHSTTLPADRWPDPLRLSDIETHFVCEACGKRGVDVRPNYQGADKGQPVRASKSRRWVEAATALGITLAV